MLNSSEGSWIRTVILSAIVVGITDYAIGFGIFVAALGRPLLGALQAPAAGLLGPAAFRGGVTTALLGTVIHFVIPFFWAVLFVIAYRNWSSLRHASSTTSGLLLLGAIIGGVIWVVMDNVVAPLGRGIPEAFGTPVYWFVLAGHMVFVGIPLVWATRHFAPSGLSNTR